MNKTTGDMDHSCAVYNASLAFLAHIQFHFGVKIAYISRAATEETQVLLEVVAMRLINHSKGLGNAIPGHGNIGAFSMPLTDQTYFRSGTVFSRTDKVS